MEGVGRTGPDAEHGASWLHSKGSVVMDFNRQNSSVSAGVRPRLADSSQGGRAPGQHGPGMSNTTCLVQLQRSARSQVVQGGHSGALRFEREPDAEPEHMLLCCLGALVVIEGLSSVQHVSVDTRDRFDAL